MHPYKSPITLFLLCMCIAGSIHSVSGDWYVEQYFNDANCLMAVKVRVFMLGKCTNITSPATGKSSMYYKKDSEDNINFYGCQDDECSKQCYGLDPEIQIECQSSGGNEGKFSKNYYSESFPSSLLLHSNGIIVEYWPGEASCSGLINSIALIPTSPCNAYCNNTLQLICTSTATVPQYLLDTSHYVAASGSSTGVQVAVIVGVIVGTVALMLVIVVIVFVMAKRRRNRYK